MTHVIYYYKPEDYDETKKLVIDQFFEDDGILKKLAGTPTGTTVLKQYEGDDFCYMFVRLFQADTTDSWVGVKQPDRVIPPEVKAFALINGFSV